jgi:hypothetical protein
MLTKKPAPRSARVGMSGDLRIGYDFDEFPLSWLFWLLLDSLPEEAPLRLWLPLFDDDPLELEPELERFLS